MLLLAVLERLLQGRTLLGEVEDHYLALFQGLLILGHRINPILKALHVQLHLLLAANVLPALGL